MAKRRTAPSVPDIVGRPVAPGDIIAVAVSQTNSVSTSALRLVLVKTIYLDDSSGAPYFDGRVYYRDRSTQLLYEAPTDETRPGWGVGIVPVQVPDPSNYVDVSKTPFLRKPYAMGHDYKGVNELVGHQAHRVQGQPLLPDGTPLGKPATYETYRIVRLDGLTVDDLHKNPATS